MTSTRCKVLLVCARFQGQSFWNFTAACEALGAKFPAPPLGLITVAALLPASWECRLVNRNAEALTDADLDWADMVMTGGMIPQRPDVQAVIRQAHARGKPVVVGGPDATSLPEAYAEADFRVLGEAEGIIDEFITAWDAGARSGTFRAEKFAIDVTKTPIPRYDLLKQGHYLYYGVQFARGCPFTCEFCDIIELYGRTPRVKGVEQILAEIEAVYNLGYRGHLDFVDDNFIGNKKAVKNLLPHLIAWQEARGYPFDFSTEASINLADDDQMLALMRAANFFTVFVGIESPDPETLRATQKKQNTRRVLADSVHKIFRAGMMVHAGFIVGFDTERQSVADAMIDLIETAAIPACMVGLLYALPNTQLSRRLEREGRLLPDDIVEQLAEMGGGDHCATGLNFQTARPRREILSDLKRILEQVYDRDIYFARLQRMARLLDRAKLSRRNSADPLLRTIGMSRREMRMACQILWRMVRHDRFLIRPFLAALFELLRSNPGSLYCLFTMTLFYCHLGPFAQHVAKILERRLEMLPLDGQGIEGLLESSAGALAAAE
ncbi:MAG TPA: radical SAM protein [Stellaceae bacterium]|nr:radical SAM protein [Stellaceae bacterium]